MTDWNARVIEDPADFARGLVRLVLWRRQGDEVAQITGFTEDGTAVLTQVPEHAVPDFRGFALPPELIEAIGEAIKPGPSRAELARVEESLAVERRRVDDVLSQALASPPATTKEH